jgi:hypothetical protein
MGERPIIFGPKSVHAILSGHKTQTRRVMMPQVEFVRSSAYTNGGYYTWKKEPLSHDATCDLWLSERCPYGRKGDRLWVREQWMPWVDEAGGLLDCIRFQDGFMFKPECPDEAAGFKFDGECEQSTACGGKYRSPIFMPRWAARATLRITGVWVQRLNDITPAECEAEGVAGTFQGRNLSGIQHEFAALWDELNARRGFSWAKNPWVWVIRFKRDGAVQ